jgi:hypothetical protein
MGDILSMLVFYSMGINCIFNSYDRIRIETKTQGCSEPNIGGAWHPFAPIDQLDQSG